ALADTYPVTQALVGETFFREMARVFVRAQPPRSPVLAWYGDAFPVFVETFPPVVDLSYLADVARLEMLRVDAYHAADATPLLLADIADLLTDEQALPEARFRLHPALRVLRSSHPALSLWAAHQTDDPAVALADVDLAVAEATLVLRPGLDVEITRIEDGAAEFIDHLRHGLAFEQAAKTVSAFDLPATLGLLIRGGAIVGVDISRSAT
ncbi:MAG: DNA-binding domain-containing protein, partial [Rhodocyclaceae bacterium]|nr:DNA-binding domain-containing protein [Rhodocyclaceae bacterium]